MVQWDRGSVPYRGPHGSMGQGTGVVSPMKVILWFNWEIFGTEAELV